MTRGEKFWIPVMIGAVVLGAIAQIVGVFLGSD